MAFGREIKFAKQDHRNSCASIGRDEDASYHTHAILTPDKMLNLNEFVTSQNTITIICLALSD